MRNSTQRRIARGSERFLVIASVALVVTLCTFVGHVTYWLEINAPYLSFLPAILGSCALGGLALASWAILFSAIELWYFFIVPDDLTALNYGDLGHLLFFVLVASLPAGSSMA